MIHKNLFKLLLFILSYFLIFSAYAEINNTPKNELSYFIKYHPEERIYPLEITLIFKGNSVGKSTLEFPSSAPGGYNDLYKTIDVVKVVGAKLKKTPDPSRYILKYKPDSVITINYRVRQIKKGPPDDVFSIFVPMLQKKYFHFIGWGIAVYPKEFLNAKPEGTIKLHWLLPKDWVLANSYGMNEREQTVRADSPLLDALFIGGDYQLALAKTKNKGIWTAVRGDKLPFTSEEFNQLIKAIVIAERNFMDSNDYPYFIASYTPAKYCYGSGGAAITNAFTSTRCPDPPFDKNDFSLLVAHEYFHTWMNGEKFHNENFQQQIRFNWFSEGFTDYYALALSFRANLINFKDYINNYNKIIVQYYTSPVNRATIDEIIHGYWKNKDLLKLPYQQGAILAHNWNVKIRQATRQQQSLDNLLKDIVSYYNQHNENISLDVIGRLADKYGLYEVKDDIYSIYRGDLLQLDKNSIGPCAYLKNLVSARYEVGFDVGYARRFGLIHSVEKNSQAFKSGLREGQQFVQIVNFSREIHHKMVVIVKDNNTEKMIAYFPYVGALKPIPQFVLDENLWRKNPNLCLKWLQN